MILGEKYLKMKNYYYPHEVELTKLIDYFFNRYSVYYITGNSGCGKSFTLKKYFMNEYKNYLFLYFVGDYLHDDKDYYPFLLGLNSINSLSVFRQGTVELAKDIPYISNFSSYIADQFINGDKDLALNPIEQELLSKIQYLLKNNKIIFLFDDLHWWDKRSLQFLDTLLNHINLDEPTENIKIFITLTPNQTCAHQEYISEIIHKLKYKHLQFPQLKFEEFNSLVKKYIKSYDTSDTNLHILFNLINNHMKVMTEVLNELERGKSVLAFETINGKEYLNKLLEQRLKEFGATGELISKVLEYASIIGISFSYYELEKITRINSQDFKKIIAHATTMELIEKTSESDIASFAHQIIRELFELRTKAGNQEYTYYLTIEQCLSTIKPAQYLRRARYLLKAGELEKATIMYILHFLQEIRNFQEISIETQKEIMPLLTDDLNWYIEQMNFAYKFHDQKEYESALEKLNLIEDFYPPVLIAEKRLLQSFCYTKSLDKETRQKSLDCIEQFKEMSSVENEIEIYERIQNRLISVYAHLGMLKDASDAEFRLMQNLRLRYQYDENARIRLNIARRTYNIVHDCKTCKTVMKKAVEYFGPKQENSIPDNLKHYYISLVNYSSTLTINGNFNEGYKYMMSALELEKGFRDFPFPRQQILYNNFAINAFLCGKLSISECISSLGKIVKQLPVIAERLTYISNLSVFYAINNEVEKALAILLEEINIQQVEYDVEGFYKFRSYTNIAIYYFLLGNKEDALKYLKAVDEIIPTLNNSIYYQEHHSLINVIIENDEKIKADEWIGYIHILKPQFKSEAWKFFGTGYILASLSNWDTEN